MSKKIEKLTKEQEALIPIVRREWLNRFLSLKFDEEKAKELINWVYTNLMKLKKPLIIILDSPLACQLATNYCKNLKNIKIDDQIDAQIRAQISNQIYDQIRDQIRAQISNQIYDQIYDQIRAQIRAQIDAQIYDQISNQIYAQIRAQISNQINAQTKKIMLEHYSISWRLNGCWDYYWVSFYDYFKRIGVVKHELFEKYKELIKCNIFSLITFNGIVFMSKPPIYIKRNEDNRLHSIDSPAIEFKDGTKYYFANGRPFSEQDFAKFFVGKTTGKEVMEINNQEQRAEVIKHIGYASLARSLKLKCISQWGVEKLYRSEVLPINLLRVIDTTSKKPYYLGVPRDKTDCLESIAWTYNVSKEEYMDMVRT